MNFKLRQLEGFIAAAELKSFSAAADRMAMTQPAFSQLIRELENLIGTRLFERTTRRVELTDAGHVLLGQARRPLEDLQRAYDNVIELAAGIRGSVRYAILPSTAFGLGTRTIAKFSQAYPEIKVQQVEDQAGLLIEKVLNREVDFGVGISNTADANLIFQSLFVDELVVTMRSDHHLAQRKALDWEDIANEALVLLPQTSSLRQLVDAGLSLAGLPRHPRFEVVNMVTGLTMAREGLGITVMPRIGLDAMKTDGLVHKRITKNKPLRQIGIIQRMDRELSPAASRFCQYLIEEAATYRSQCHPD